MRPCRGVTISELQTKGWSQVSAFTFKCYSSFHSWFLLLKSFELYSGKKGLPYSNDGRKLPKCEGFDHKMLKFSLVFSNSLALFMCPMANGVAGFRSRACSWAPSEVKQWNLHFTVFSSGILLG